VGASENDSIGSHDSRKPEVTVSITGKAVGSVTNLAAAVHAGLEDGSTLHA
jgi:hypothetical protein